MDWFSIEKIDEKTYAISEYNHWEKMHSYLLLGKDYAALIDTGLGIGNIKKEVNKLTNLPVKVITTHVHWDHIGGHGDFNDISVHEGDALWMEEGLPIPDNAIKKDVIKDVQSIPDGFDIDEYKVCRKKPSCVLTDGQTIDLGGRILEVIHTPGHSPGHICIYDRKNKYLFCGDLVYMGTLYAFYPSTDPIVYKESVRKIMSYDIEKILPAHNSLDIPDDFIGRVYEAFCCIEKECGLKQGAGTFDFNDFSIHI